MLNAVKSAVGGKTFYKTILKTMMLIAFLFSICGTTHADEKIKLKLHQPPPNQLGVKDLWKLDVTNTTRENINIYLTGTATETKKGLIVSGKSKVFSVSPGKKTYTYDDFKSGEVNWKDKSVQEVLLRTGNVPEGEYTICVTAFYENNEVADQESCIEQSIKLEGSITLISPEDGAEIDPNQPLTFTWTPLPGAKEYTLKLVEVKGDQSPEAKMKKGTVKFFNERITTTTFQYPMSEKKLEAGKKYAWQVTSGDVESEVFSFNISKEVIQEVQTREQQMEQANQTFRSDVASALQEAALLAGVRIRTDDFVAIVGAQQETQDKKEDIVTPVRMMGGGEWLWAIMTSEGGIICKTPGTSCNLLRLVKAKRFSTWHDAELAKYTDQINAILDELKAQNKDRTREPKFIVTPYAPFLAWVQCGDTVDFPKGGITLQDNPDKSYREHGIRTDPDKFYQALGISTAIESYRKFGEHSWERCDNYVECTKGGTSQKAGRLITADILGPLHDRVLQDYTNRINTILDDAAKRKKDPKHVLSLLVTPRGLFLAWSKYGMGSPPKEAITADDEEGKVLLALGIEGDQPFRRVKVLEVNDSAKNLTIILEGKRLILDAKGLKQFPKTGEIIDLYGDAPSGLRLVCAIVECDVGWGTMNCIKCFDYQPLRTTDVIVNAGIEGVENLTLEQLAQGADVLFTFMRLPQGSALPSGFYTVRIFQTPGTTQWRALFKNLQGQVVLETDAEVVPGDPAQQKPPKFTVKSLPNGVLVDFHFTKTSGNVSVELGTGGPDTTLSHPVEQKIVKAATDFQELNFQKLNATTVKGGKINMDNRIMIGTGDDGWIVHTVLQGVEKLTLEELAKGQDVFFQYYGMSKGSRIPSGFYEVKIFRDNQSGKWVSQIRDMQGLLVREVPAEVTSSHPVPHTNLLIEISAYSVRAGVVGSQGISVTTCGNCNNKCRICK